MNFPRVVVDLGGTNLRIGIFENRRSLVDVLDWSLRDWTSPETWLSELEQTSPEVLESSWVVGIPGTIGPDGSVGSTPNLPDPWSGSGLADALRGRGIPVGVENDANLFALGEYHRGSGQESSSMLGCTLGTGFGSGLVMDGRLYAGHHGFASEAGHVTLVPDGRLCTCGDTGCAETYVSGRGLEATYRDLTGGGSLSAKEIVDRVDGDLEAAQAVESFGYDLGRHLANLVNLLDVETVVLGGGVARGFQTYEEPALHAFRLHLFSEGTREHKILPARLEESALWGGAVWSPETRSVTRPG